MTSRLYRIQLSHTFPPIHVESSAAHGVRSRPGHSTALAAVGTAIDDEDRLKFGVECLIDAGDRSNEVGQQFLVPQRRRRHRRRYPARAARVRSRRCRWRRRLRGPLRSRRQIRFRMLRARVQEQTSRGRRRAPSPASALRAGSKHGLEIIQCNFLITQSRILVAKFLLSCWLYGGASSG